MDDIDLAEIFRLINPIIGTDDADRLEGTEANDFMFGLAGNDVINGGDEIDFLFGNDGDDTLIGDRGDDDIAGGDGDDLIIWNNGDGSDTNDGGSGHDTQQVNGADGPGDEFQVVAGGSDVIFSRLNLGLFDLDLQNIESLEVNGQGGDDSFKVGDLDGTALDNVTFNGGDGNDTLDATHATRSVHASGGKGHDLLNGGEAVDTLNGDNGDDTIIGFLGNDFMNGGDGDDLLIWNNGDGSDIMNGGQGHDTVQVNAADAASDDVEIGTDASGFFFERVNLGPFKLDISEVETLDVNTGGGNDRVNLVEGAINGVDLDLDAGAELGNDVADERSDIGRADTIDLNEVDLSEFVEIVVDLDVNDDGGEAGIIALNDGEETTHVTLTDFENIVGSNADETLIGNDEANVIRGRGGDDIIAGKEGADFLEGNSGMDQFVYANGEGGDVIGDFNVAEDTLVLDAESFGLAEGSTVHFQNVARDGDGTDAGLVDVQDGNNVFVLQGGFENAGEAADALANALAADGTEDGAQGGFFVYHNVNLGVNRLFAVEDLDDVDSAFQQLANLDDEPDANAFAQLPDFEASNFAFLGNGLGNLVNDGDAV